MKILLSVINILILTLALQAAVPETDSIPKKNNPYPKSALLSYQYGKVIQTHDFVKGENPNQEAYENFMAFTGEFGIHTDGRKLWQQLYHYPIWGFGLYKGFLLNDYDELGNPLATYAFFKAPFKRWKKWSIDYNVGFGVSFNWNKHDIIEDGQYFYPIGTFSTIYFAFSLGANIQISKHLDLNAGLTYTHFSNGAVKLPNLGINFWSPQISLQYIFNERPEFIHQEKPHYLKEWEWIVILAPAFRQVSYEFDDNGTKNAIAFDYSVLTFSTSFNRQFTHLVKLGAGFDLTYNEAYGAEIDKDEDGNPVKDEDGNPVKGPSLPYSDQLLVGVYPAFELIINKLSMVVQSGFYVYRKDIPVTDAPTTYQRIGLKYHFADHFILGLNIRAYNFSKADFIEWVIGYRIKWQKSYRK